MWKIFSQFIESLIKCDAKGDVETNSNARKEIENSEVKEEQKLLMCPDEGCHRTFQRYGALQNHMLYGRHEKNQEKITLIDRAKRVTLGDWKCNME